MNSKWRIIALNPEKEIGAVWRLSDGKKFYIGDPTPQGSIVGFLVNQGSLMVKCGRARRHGIPELSQTTLLFLHELS